MKNKMKALLLALSLTMSTVALPAAAAESVTENVAEEMSEAESEVSAEENAQTPATQATVEDQLKQMLTELLTNLSASTDEQLDQMVEKGDESSKKIAANWLNVKEELGSFVELVDPQVTAEGNVYKIHSRAKYDQVSDKTEVTIDFVYDMPEQKISLDWNVDYPMSKLMEEAGLNTLMGLGIVFLTLLFLSFIISRMKLLSGVGNKKKEEQAAVAAAAPQPTEEPEEEEDVTDDGELVAVIAAAIAVSENTSTDGFVVRSIKKANRKKWQNA